MQKKKSQAKINLPSVGVKPNETSKNYGSKSNMNKCREIEEKNIYFEMPSIHQNDLTLKAFIEDDRPIHKLQLKVLRYLETVKEGKLAEEWDLYIKKSEILNTRNLQFAELEDYLIKTIYRLLLKLNQAQHASSFSFNRSLRTTQNLESDLNVSLSPNPNPNPNTSLDANSARINKTCFEDRILDQGDSRMGRQSPNKTTCQVISDGGLNQQNVLLEKRAQLYQRRIEELSRMLSRFQDKEKQGAGEKETSNEFIQVVAAKNKYKYESEVKSMHIESLSMEIKATKEQNTTLTEKLASAESILDTLLEENKKCREFLKYKELWQMASEEAAGWQGYVQDERQERDRALAKIKLLKEKNKQLLNYFNMSNAVNPDQEEDKQDLDKIIKEFKEWLMIISVPKVSPQTSVHAEQQRLGDELNVKLLRPNFYIFFQAFQSTLVMEKNIINIRPIEYNFFLKLRCIFDALFRRFLLARSFKDYPSFPQFVVGFLEKYQVNPETGKVQFRRNPIQSEEKITFLVNLFNKNFCNTWQCEIFKQFMFENYYLDEIFFFLDCRNEFGPTPAQHSICSVDPVLYVKLTKALKVVSKQLAPYENYIVERVKNILRSKKKVKYGQAFVDKHFVLKLLLEVYSLERVKSQRVFQSSFTAKMKKSYITFGDCHHFLTTNFPFLSSPHIAEIYRELYTLSSGHVTHKALHYLCASKGLFIPLLLEKRVSRVAEKSLSTDMLLLDVQNVVTKMVPHLQEFGEQSFMGFEHSLNGFMRQLDFFKANKAAFYHRLLIQKCNIVRINTLLQLAASYELNACESMEDSQVQTHMIQLHSMIHQTDTQVHLLARQRDRRNKAWRMIVRNFKIRIQQSILQFEKVNEEEIKKLRDQLHTTNLNKEQALEEELKRQKINQTSVPI